MQDDEERTATCAWKTRAASAMHHVDMPWLAPVHAATHRALQQYGFEMPVLSGEIEQIEVPPQPEGGEGAAAGVSPPPPPVPPKSNSRGWRSVVPSRGEPVTQPQRHRRWLPSPWAPCLSLSNPHLRAPATASRRAPGRSSPCPSSLRRRFRRPTRSAPHCGARQEGLGRGTVSLGGLPHASPLLPMPSRRLRIVTLILSLALPALIRRWPCRRRVSRVRDVPWRRQL